MKNFQTLIALSTALTALFSIESESQAATLYANKIGDLSLTQDRIITINTDGSIGSSFVKPAKQGADTYGGITVVGNDLYYTQDNSNMLYKTDLAGNLQSSVPTRFTSPNAISWDGSAFWISQNIQYQNIISRVDTNGNNIKTIGLSNFIVAERGAIGGLEYFDGKLIASPNVFRNKFSIYDLNGNVLQDNFIDTTGRSNTDAIAYDGKDFYVAGWDRSAVDIYDGVTGAYSSSITLRDNGQPYTLGDISFNYLESSMVTPVTPTSVPEPFTVIGTIVGGTAALRMRKKMKSTSRV